MARKRRGRVLLIIAPDMLGCAKAAKAFGLVPPHIENYRNVTRAAQLRGIDPGTPFITFDRHSWGNTQVSYDLDVAVTCYTRTGHLRIAQPDDIEAHRSYPGVPDRPMATDGRGNAPQASEARL